MADLSIIKYMLKSKGVKVKDFCEQLGMSEQGFAKIIRSNSTKIETLELIADKLGIPVATFFKEEARVVDEKPIVMMEIPVVPIYAHAGYLKGFGDAEYIDSLPTMPIITDRQYKGIYRIFEVSGDSMYDGTSQSLLSGDKVLAREIRQDLWYSKLHIRQWYFVILHRTEGLIVKQIVDHDVESGIITCHSLNPMFEDFKLNLADVAQMYNVVSIVAREMHF